MRNHGFFRILVVAQAEEIRLRTPGVCWTPLQRTLLTDTRGGTPAKLLFKSAGDSVESRNEFVRTLQYAQLVVRGSEEPGGASNIPSKTPGDRCAFPY